MSGISDIRRGAAMISKTDKRLTDRLFFALRPDAATCAAIEAQRARLIAEQGLLGQPLPAEQFHITLYFLGDFVRFPQKVAEQAMAAAGSVVAPPVDIVLDRAVSFTRHKSGPRPCVLLAGEPLEPLRQLRAQLTTALKTVGLYRYAEFKPHLTLLRDPIAVEEQAVEPLRWRADELLLMNSRLGHSEHVRLAGWPLRAS
jgi:RNA 2',3'-cyclic 3'-phosphodiesterase